MVPTRALSHILFRNRDLEAAVRKLNHKLHFTNILRIFMWDFFSTYFHFPFSLAISFPTPSMQGLLLDTGGAQPYAHAISKTALGGRMCDMYLMGVRDRDSDALIPPPQP